MHNDIRELSSEEIIIKNEKIKKEPDDFNIDDSFLCQTTENSTESSLYILNLVKEEPHVSESSSIADFKDAEIEKFHPNLDRPNGHIGEQKAILSYIDRRLVSINAEHTDSKDVPVTLLKRRLITNEDETNARGYLVSKMHYIHSNVKKKTDKTKSRNKGVIKEEPSDLRGSCSLIDNTDFSCEEIKITNEKIEEESEDFSKDNTFLYRTTKDSTESSLYILDIKKEEPRVSESPSIAEESEDILSYIDAEQSGSDDDVPISLLKRRLAATDSQTKNNSLKRGRTKKAYKCKECNIAFNDRKAFRTHCRSHIYGDKHQCNICGRKFARRGYLHKHLVIHEEKKKYKCSVCEKSFKQPSTLWTHMKIHNDQKPFQCETCGKKFHFKANYESHLLVHLNISHPCPKCGKEYRTKRYLLSHLDEHDGKKKNHKRIIKPCDQCDKKELTSTDALCEHQKYYSDRKSCEKCQLCGKQFTSKQYLNIHMENHKGITKKCIHCHKEYKNSVTLRRHMKSHTKLFKCEKCPLCSKQFTSKHSLNIHIDNHKEITTKCDQCGKEFTNGDNLRRHIKWHANPKPFNCKNCGKSLARKYTYIRHMEFCKPVGNLFEEAVTFEESVFHSQENKEVIVNIT